MKSLADQFARRHALSQRQVVALRRVVSAYHDKIPDFEEKSKGLGLDKENAGGGE